MKFKEEKSNPSSAAPTIKSSASAKINKKAPKKQVEKPEEFNTSLHVRKLSKEFDKCKTLEDKGCSEFGLKFFAFSTRRLC